MEALGAERREKRQVENLSKIVGLEKLEGLRFKFRPEGQLGRVFVKVLGKTEQGLNVRAIESGTEYNDVPPEQLSIGVATRREGDPLIELLKENGMESEQYLQRLAAGSEGLRARLGHNPEGRVSRQQSDQEPVRGFSGPGAERRGEFGFRRGPPQSPGEVRRPVPLNPGFAHHYGFNQPEPVCSTGLGRTRKICRRSSRTPPRQPQGVTRGLRVFASSTGFRSRTPQNREAFIPRSGSTRFTAR